MSTSTDYCATSTPEAELPRLARGWLNRTRQTRGVVVRCLHKSASMFVYKFCKRVASDCGFQFYSANNQPANEHLATSGLDTSFCVAPVRHFRQEEFSSFPRLDQTFQIFQVRDPRDILVSEYFSYGWIHSDSHWNERGLKRREKLRKMTIDEYAAIHPEFAPYPLEKKFQPLLDLLDARQQAGSKHRDLVLLKYETMVTDFPAWLKEAMKPFGFRFPRMTRSFYAKLYSHEFRTRGEQMKHKRRITPGDHQDKLQPETISMLNERYAAILDRFGYQR